MLREAGHTVVFVEHDPSLFDGAAAMLEPVASALKEVARESLVILYTPVADRTFSALARKADHYIEIVPVEENPASYPHHPYPAAVRPASLRAADAGGVVNGQDISQCPAGSQQHGGPVGTVGPGAQKGRPAVRRTARGTGKDAFERGVCCLRRPS